jgi:hypothetical protein
MKRYKQIAALFLPQITLMAQIAGLAFVVKGIFI